MEIWVHSFVSPQKVLGLEYWQLGGHFYSVHPCRRPPTRQKGPPSGFRRRSMVQGSPAITYRSLPWTDLPRSKDGKFETGSRSRRGREKRVVLTQRLPILFSLAFSQLQRVVWPLKVQFPVWSSLLLLPPERQPASQRRPANPPLRQGLAHLPALHHRVVLLNVLWTAMSEIQRPCVSQRYLRSELAASAGLALIPQRQ
jgi:hypothetical protein